MLIFTDSIRSGSVIVILYLETLKLSLRDSLV